MEDLVKAILIQAAKDYVRGDEKEKKEILADLRGKWMRTISDDSSLTLANILEKNPERVEAALSKKKKRC